MKTIIAAGVEQKWGNYRLFDVLSFRALQRLSNFNIWIFNCLAVGVYIWKWIVNNRKKSVESDDSFIKNFIDNGPIWLFSTVWRAVLRPKVFKIALEIFWKLFHSDDIIQSQKFNNYKIKINSGS